MNHWLLKTEPSEYSFDDLARDGETRWTGVKNAAALIHLRSMRKGDTVLIYHTGTEKSVVGIGKVVAAIGNPKSDGDRRDVAVQIKPVRRLVQAVPIATLRRDSRFADWELIRNSRLSVMPVPEPIFTTIVEMGSKKLG